MINAKLMLSCYLLEEVLEEKLQNPNLTLKQKNEVKTVLSFLQRLTKIELILHPYQTEEEENILN